MTSPHPAHQLAQVNIARLLAPLESAQLAGFVNALDEVNAVADAADGFVWRLQGDGNDATSLRVFGDEWLIVNMSVWRDPESLSAYVYGERHLKVLRRRREWFHHPAEAMTALWWVDSGVRPSVADAEHRLTVLRTEGPTAAAFPLKPPFPAPSLAGPVPVAP